MQFSGCTVFATHIEAAFAATPLTCSGETKATRDLGGEISSGK
jgi:hypothetical protein